uniref:DNA cytosine methyltransferase n=1 Tax=Candidatus Stercorousia sp. TaxID=3048886 RepID=UPI004029DC23
HAYVYLEFLILACTIYILEPAFTISTRSGSRNYDNFIFEKDVTDDKFIKVSKKGLAKVGVDLKAIEETNIRKLTPNECMLLMGLKKEREKLKDFTPNEIYKLTGNSIVIPVLISVFNEYFKALKDNGKLDGMDMAS